MMHAEPAPRARCPRCGSDRTHHIGVRHAWGEQIFEWCDACNRSFETPRPTQTQAASE